MFKEITHRLRRYRGYSGKTTRCLFRYTRRKMKYHAISTYFTYCWNTQALRLVHAVRQKVGSQLYSGINTP